MFKRPPATGRPARSALVAMLARRAGRAGFGFAMLTGACALVSAAIVEPSLDAATILVTTWLVAAAVGLAAWAIARLVAHRWEPDALRYAGLVAPAVGLALVAPLTVHMVILMGLMSGSAHDLDEWVKLSLWITGAAHIAFAAASGYRVVALIRGTRALTVGAIFQIVVLVSCVPFIVFLVPPILVALTGIPMLPILFAPEAIVARERAIVELTPAVAYARGAR